MLFNNYRIVLDGINVYDNVVSIFDMEDSNISFGIVYYLVIFRKYLLLDFYFRLFLIMWKECLMLILMIFYEDFILRIWGVSLWGLNSWRSVCCF